MFILHTEKRSENWDGVKCRSESYDLKHMADEWLSKIKHVAQFCGQLHLCS